MIVQAPAAGSSELLRRLRQVGEDRLDLGRPVQIDVRHEPDLHIPRRLRRVDLDKVRIRPRDEDGCESNPHPGAQTLRRPPGRQHR